MKEQICNHCPPPKKGTGLAQGIAFGLVPHIGCIAFIIASILCLSIAASIFRPLLATSHLFYAMIALSLVFATISAFFYLRKCGGIATAKEHKNYLIILYGSTILVSALLYFVIFPAVTSSPLFTGHIVAHENLNIMTLEVEIPCSGHAPLITDELKKVDGIIEVEYASPKTFKVQYDPSKTSEQEILSLEIFKEFKATIIV